MGANLVKIASSLVVAYGFYAAFCFFAQRFIIYPGRTIRAPAAPPGPSAGIVPVRLETRFGRTEAWFLPGKGVSPGRRPALLFFHGNGEIIDFLPEQLEGFRAMGMGVLLVEYPGYGRSEGKPSEAGIAATAVAAYDAMAGRNDVDPARMVAFGRSLGCGPACDLSRQRPLAALILQSPFISTRAFARRFLVPGFLIRDVYDNRTALTAFAGPVLILHGRSDDIVPFSHGEELARVARNASFVALDCTHNDCPPDWREFWRILADFLRLHGIVA
jgi:fermentation-respiration switch protein FrsA (DUF1100 family)